MSDDALNLASKTILEIVEKYGTPSNPDIVKASAVNQLYQNPEQALLEEEVIQNASEPMLCMAAFLAEFAQGMKQAVSIIEQKVDFAISLMTQTSGEVVKANQSTLDIMKAMSNSPAEQFQHQNGLEGKEEALEKAAKMGKGIPREFTIGFLEEQASLNKCNMMDIANFENTGKVPSHLEASLLTAWKNNN